MSVTALSRAVLLVPELVKIMHSEMTVKACRKRGIGMLRTRYEGQTDAYAEAPRRILAEICRACPLACEMARKE